MQLLLPDSDLAGISVEGLEPAAQSYASAETVEVADIAVFYGQRATFAGAKRVEIIQFKYSVSRAETEFRAFDAKKTIQKFAAAYRDYKRTFGVAAIEKKLTFELITNRPILPELVDAINGLASGLALSGDAKKQATQFKTAAGLTGKDLKRFAGRCVVSGLTGNLHRTKSDLRRLIVDWSATPSALTTSRIGQVRQLVRNKAGSEGAHGKNVIRRVDLYEALGIEGLDDLLPCPESLPEIGTVVPREQLPKAIASIPDLDKPLLVHGDGGIGKTVFLDSLAAALSDQSEVVFFDCFGSGRYRTAEDSRHLPNRGLVHIVNTLACRGLCDPLLPGSDSQETLFKIFRKRLKQCIAALHRVSPDRRLVLFLDAIDNAAEHANDRGESSFPTLLLESLENDPIDGLRLIVSCRTYRRKRAVKDVQCQEIHLSPFTFQESKKYILDRKPTASESEINVAQARSNGNGRILEHLLTGDRGLLDPSELGKPIKLDELLQDRIDKALREAIKRGSRKRDIDAFLAGLAVLPPPVPITEYAGAHDIDVSAIESFAADLAPLLDNTNQGMMFRDEPTESLVRDKYAADVSSLKRVATRLNARQDESVYAARTLPGLLLKIRDGNKLFKLAFDDRAPPALSSTVGRRRIQFERLQAAAMHAADTTNYDKLVQLLVAMSTIAAADQKGADYILDNPDLTVSAQDAEAMRRLFETRTNWPGARHARLTIANLLSEDLDDAHRHFQGAQEWIIHELNRDKDQFRDRERVGPERLDHASLPAFLIAQGDPSSAIRFMRIWFPWYSHELSGHLFSILGIANQQSALKPEIDGYLDGLGNEIGCLTGALAFLNLRDGQRRTLIDKLARACERRTDLKHNDNFSRQQSNDLADGLRKSSALALFAGLSKEALKISLRVPHARPQVWSFRDQMMDKHVFGFLFRVALVAAANGKSVHELDILPSDLSPIARGIPRSVSGQSFRERLAKRVDRKLAKDREEEDHDRRISSEFKASVERFLQNRIELVLNLTKAFSLVLSAPNGRVDKPFKQLVDLWHVARSKTTYYTTHEIDHFFNILGTTMAAFAIAVRHDLKAASIRKYLTQWHKYPLGASMLVEIIRVLALRPRLITLAGEQAIRAADYIERDDDVSTRAALYSALARSIHPANKDDAVAFFRRGLEQLDAIGSGDHDFTNELLLFASELKGDELKEPEFHTLTNICELNMSYEPEKFPWASFGAGMSKASGLRGLAKLCRWQERSKIDLEHTLLPYLTALIRDDKIRPEDAIALNWVADPAELWSCNTETFANAIHDKSYGNASQFFEELIRQFEAQNPRIVAKSTVEALGQICREVFGARHATTMYLKAASNRFGAVINELNKQSNYRPNEDQALSVPREKRQQQTIDDARQIADQTDPLDENSLFAGIAKLDKEQPGRKREKAFLARLRARVRGNDRSNYLRNIVAATNLDYYAKYNELEKAHALWGASSVSLSNTLAELAIPLVREHADEFISFERLSGYEIRKISTLTGVSEIDVCIELILIFVGNKWSIPASTWLGLAAFVCREAGEGSGQKALSRLLMSDIAQLSSSVADGAWQQGLYPRTSSDLIIAGVIWLMLGAPKASDRWRAAHAVRCLARLGRWEVIAALVARLSPTDARGYQAPELGFYYLHARLWLLIALARVALSNPKGVAKYRSQLLALTKSSNVLIRHFAARAVLACFDAGEISVGTAQVERLRSIDKSPFPTESLDPIRDRYQYYYQDRKPGQRAPPNEFSLDYDFEKSDVQNLCTVFDQPGWIVKDLLCNEAAKIDSSIMGMYEDGGREPPGSASLRQNSGYHRYGYYIGWHALLAAAGHLLTNHPVVRSWAEEEPWDEWIRRRQLTRIDGLWLADGVDRPPPESQINVLEPGPEGLVLTGDEGLLRRLIGVKGATVRSDLAIDGDWRTPDGISVHITSALVPTKKSARLAKELIEKEPFFAYLPRYYEYEDEEEHLRGEMKEYEPWIVCPGAEAGIDERDPHGVIDVMRRPRFVSSIAEEFSVRINDAFARDLRGRKNKRIASSQAWGHKRRYEEELEGCTRLMCTPRFLSEVLQERKRDLLVLIKLQRYKERNSCTRDSSFTNSLAVVRISRDLKVIFKLGKVNYRQKSVVL